MIKCWMNDWIHIILKLLQILIRYWQGREIFLTLLWIIEQLCEESYIDDTEQTYSKTSSFHQFGSLNAAAYKKPRQTRGLTLIGLTKYSKKQTFLLPWYAHVRVSIRRCEMLVFQKIFHAYKINDPTKASFFPKMILGKNYFRVFCAINIKNYIRVSAPVLFLLFALHLLKYREVK